MSTILLYPAPGRQVRDPVTMRPLAAEGEEKPRDTYWLRRLIDGDVTEAQPPKKTKEA